MFALFVLRDLSFLEYGALSAPYAALVVVSEVPTGDVGDRFGRRASMAADVACTALSLAGFVVAGRTGAAAAPAVLGCVVLVVAVGPTGTGS